MVLDYMMGVLKDLAPIPEGPETSGTSLVLIAVVVVLIVALTVFLIRKFYKK